MWSVTLNNRGRQQHSTATIYRLQALMSGIARRYPAAKKSPAPRMPMTVRSRVAGPVIAIVHALEGPVASVSTKH